MEILPVMKLLPVSEGQRLNQAALRTSLELLIKASLSSWEQRALDPFQSRPGLLCPVCATGASPPLLQREFHQLQTNLHEFNGGRKQKTRKPAMGLPAVRSELQVWVIIIWLVVARNRCESFVQTRFSCGCQHATCWSQWILPDPWFGLGGRDESRRPATAHTWPAGSGGGGGNADLSAASTHQMGWITLPLWGICNSSASSCAMTRISGLMKVARGPGLRPRAGCEPGGLVVPGRGTYPLRSFAAGGAFASPVAGQFTNYVTSLDGVKHKIWELLRPPVINFVNIWAQPQRKAGFETSLQELRVY